MSRPGDWNCRSCNHLNFQRRDSCQRCGDPKPGSGGGAGADYGGGGGGGFRFSSGPDVRPGDWYCALANCGAHNFASRCTCFKCGAYKDELGGGGGGRGFSSGFSNLTSSAFGTAGTSTSRSGWKSGDWICIVSGCNEHNFASRTDCFRCNAPREASSASTTRPPY